MDTDARSCPSKSKFYESPIRLPGKFAKIEIHLHTGRLKGFMPVDSKQDRLPSGARIDNLLLVRSFQ